VKLFDSLPGKEPITTAELTALHGVLVKWQTEVFGAWLEADKHDDMWAFHGFLMDLLMIDDEGWSEFQRIERIRNAKRVHAS
jgi:hypothetical protein